MNLKLRISALLLLLLTVTPLLAVSSSAAAFSPALNVISSKYAEMNVSGIVSNPIRFSRDMFSDAVGSELISKITVSSLPDDPECGKLLLYGKEIYEGYTLSASDISGLTFMCSSSSPEIHKAVFTVSSSGVEYDISCSLKTIECLNFAPYTESSEKTVTAFNEVYYYGKLKARDPENDSLVFEILSYPTKGALTLLDSASGEYVYVPNKGAYGVDRFEYRVCDAYGNRSKAEIAEFQLEAPVFGVFKDIHRSKSEYAATLLCQKEIFTPESLAGEMFFAPSKSVSREDFIMMAMSCTGIDRSSIDNINGDISMLSFSDLDSVAPSKLEYVLSACALGYLTPDIGADGYLLRGSSPITLEEACGILNNMLPLNAESNDAWSSTSAAEASIFFDNYPIPELGGLSSGSSKIILSRGDIALMLCAVMENI